MPRLLTAAAQKKENLDKVFLSAAHGESDFKFLEAAAGDEGKKLKTFSMVGYTGGAMRVGFGYPVVVDLAGMDVPTQKVPILKDHDSTKIVAHSTEIEKLQKRIKLAGVISGVGEAAKEVQDLAANEFPWQASIGASIERMEFIDRGESVTVNGQSFTGPLYVARKSKLVEVSFVAIGADTSTSARVAASHFSGAAMKFDQWLQAKGFDPAALSEGQREFLKASFDAEEAAKNEPAPKPIKASGTEAGDEDPIAKLRASQAAEYTRIAKIEAAAKGHPDIIASAIEGNWDETRVKNEVELKTLRAGRPSSPGIHVVDKSVGPLVLQAAMCQVGRLANIEKVFDDKTLQAAHTQFAGRLGLQELALECAWANGYSGRSFRRDPEGVLRAAFSTADISGILSNIANKFILNSYMAVERVWTMIAAIASTSDFKERTSYRLTGDLEFEPIGPDGEIKHGKLGEQSYGNKAKTYAKLLSITREDWRNDDQGALTKVPAMLGRGAGLKINTVFWTEFMDNSDFFKSENNNYDEGSDTALGIDGLTAGELLFLDQVDTEGKPLGLTPKILLTPNALSAKAAQLMSSLELRDTTANTKAPISNPHAGKFQTASSSYLGNSSFTGNSTKAWYLLADPMDVPVIEIAFLDGKQEPTVESADCDFSTLGVQMRGYFDFGVRKQDEKAGVKMKGEA